MPLPVRVLQDLYGPCASLLSQRLLDEFSVRINSYGASRLRAVTHHQFTADDIETVVHGFSEVLPQLQAAHAAHKQDTASKT